MGIRNTPEQSRAYTAALRERRRASGVVRVELYAHRDDVAAIKQHAEDLARIRAAAGVPA